MSNNIILKKSSVGDKVPVAGDLQYGELAINYADGNLFYKNSSNIVTTIASNKLVSVTGNVTGSYFIGNGSLLTGVVATGSSSSIANGTSNIVAYNSGNIAVSVANVSNIVTFTTQGIVTSGTSGNISGVDVIFANTLSITGNITGSYFVGNGSLLTGLPSSYSNANVAAYLPTYTGNLVSLTGAVTTTANVTGSYFVGNGSLLTGLPSSYSNANVAAYLPTYTGNLVSLTGAVTTTANIQAGYFIGNGSTLTSITGANVTGTVANATTATAATTAGTVTTAAQPNITSVGTLTSVSVTGNVVGGNILTLGTPGNITGANVIVATTLSATGNIIGGNLITGNITIGTDTIKSANAILTLDPAADGVSGLVVIAGNLQVTGTTTTIDSTTVYINDLMFNVANNAATSSAANGGGLGVGPVGTEYVKLYWDAAGNTWDSTHGISAVGTVTATNFVGSGADLSSIAAANVTGQVANALVAGTVYTAAQTNITSVGTLSSLAVTGNISGGNISATSIAGTLSTAAQTNITSVGTLTSLSASGNIAGSYFTGNGSLLTGIAAGGIKWTTVANTAPAGASPGDFWYNSTTGIKYQYINDGTGNIWIDQSAPTTFATITVGGIVNLNASGVGNIGASGATFNTVFAKATSAQYADLAEIYVADADYPASTVVVFGGPEEITISNLSHDTRVAGVISTNPAYVMNSAANGLPVALTGRVPCQVQGPVAKGDILVTGDIPGVAQKLTTWQPGCILGKSLEKIISNEIRTIEVVVGRF